MTPRDKWRLGVGGAWGWVVPPNGCIAAAVARRAAVLPVLASAPIFHVRAVPTIARLTVRVQNSSAHMATVHTGGKVLHALKR